MSAVISKTSFIACMMLFALAATAQDAPNPFAPEATHLVNDIMSRAGSPMYVTLAVENRSALSASDVALAKKAIEEQLRAASVRLVKPERAVAEITVTISENPQGLLWVAEVRQGPTPLIVMLQSGQPPVAYTRMPTLSVKRIPLFTQPDGAAQIIDFALLDANDLLVMEPERLVAYSLDAGKWKQQNAFAIQHLQPWPRDLRGHIAIQPAQITLFLPGVQCSGALQDKTVSGIACQQTDDPWLLPGTQTRAFYPATRNFFSGVISGVDQSLPPFFSAVLVGDTNPVWILSGTDGHARLYGALNQQPHIYSGWGSDVAGVRSSCGSQWQVLVSRPGDATQTDAVQAMEIANRDASPVSPPLEVSGPVTSMWPAAGGQIVDLVTRNLATGKYEASILTIDCGR